MAYPNCSKRGIKYIESFYDDDDIKYKNLKEYKENDHNVEEKEISNEVFVNFCLKNEQGDNFIIVLDGPQMKTSRYICEQGYPDNIIAVQGSLIDYERMKETKKKYKNLLKDVEIVYSDLLEFVKNFKEKYTGKVWAIYYDAMSNGLNDYNINLMYNLKKIMHPEGYITTTLFCRINQSLEIYKRIFGLINIDKFYENLERSDDNDDTKTDMATFVSVAYWNIMQCVFNENINMVYIRDYNTEKGQKLFLQIYKLGEEQNWEDCEYKYDEPINFKYTHDNELMIKVKFVSFRPEWFTVKELNKFYPNYLEEYEYKLKEMGLELF